MEARQEPTRCPTCGDVVGVYEPSVVALPDGRVLHASMAALGDDLGPGVVVRHRACQLERSGLEAVQVDERELSRSAHGVGSASSR